MSSQISVEKLSKQYRIGLANRHSTLRESLIGLMTLSFLRANAHEETIWALQNVSFSIKRGEAVGIIGRNGAGKSTLLKILSRITNPTSGIVAVDGKVASLLEVGTGFHQELTGRENIYLNGSILGMAKKEVDRKLDAIVEFSGVAKFLDTPIKRYSSGMRLRLGFAVAAHLDPDILIVDEVLAVGDAEFQKKCLNTMENLRGGARTVLFVSHNLAAVENLCERCIWIDGGQIRMDGETRSVIEAYMGSVSGAGTVSSELEDVPNRRGSGKVRYRAVEFISPERNAARFIRAGDPVVMRFHYEAAESIPSASFGFRMYTDMGTLVTDTSTSHHGIHVPLEAGKAYLDLEIDCLNLLPAKYTLSLWLTDMDGVEVYDNLEHAVTLEVEASNIYQSGKVIDSRLGIVFFPQKWNLAGISGRAEQLTASLVSPGRS
ncbi:MAG TPA: ABC transporter ATP-binding protein [Verrucomicrobiae bacterium]|nr:ABC transporter ATP-binding protein [Verrucomicrobiae bacterium]